MKFFLFVWLSSLLVTFIKGECDLHGQIPPDYWQENSSFPLLSTCEGSYFKIDILSNSTVNETLLNYNLNLGDLYEKSITNQMIEEDIHLASLGASFEISVSAENDSQPVVFPNMINFQEVKMRFDESYVNSNQNDSVRFDTFKANSEYRFNLAGFGDVKLFDLSYSMPDRLGYLALDNGNGRLTLFTSKSQLKVAVKSKTNLVKWIVKTSKSPNPQENSHFSTDYALGPPELTTSTSTTTTTSRPPDGAVRIFIVAINENQFYREKFDDFYAEVTSLADEKGNCTFTRTGVKSCGVTCAMTDDPDRGCLTFALTLKKSTLCFYEEDDFRKDLDSKLKILAEHYGASRIDLEDCLTPAQIQWITIAVLIPLASMAFVGISYFMVKNWMKELAKRRIFRRHELNRMRKSTPSLMTLNKKRMSGARTTSQFEIIEED